MSSYVCEICGGEFEAGSRARWCKGCRAAGRQVSQAAARARYQARLRAGRPARPPKHPRSAPVLRSDLGRAGEEAAQGPSAYPPGSAGKIAILAGRADAGLPLFDRRDWTFSWPPE